MADGLHHAKLLLSLAKGMARVARLCHSVSEKEAGSHGRWFAPRQAVTISR